MNPVTITFITITMTGETEPQNRDTFPICLCIRKTLNWDDKILLKRRWRKCNEIC